MKEVINPNEFKKLFVDESVDGNVTTTYIGTTEYANEYPRGFAESGDTAKPIWRIKKITVNSSTGITEVSYPKGSYGFNFIWDNRTTLTYK